MKANRKFVQADEAVSPVIAVILMVAITVVLAATVFVLVSDIGGNTGSAAPVISFTVDEGTDRLTVSSAASNADWNRINVVVSACVQVAASSAIGKMGTDASAYQNEAGTDTGIALNQAALAGTSCGAAVTTPAEVTNAADKIDAGDYLEFCSSPAAADMTNVKLELRDNTANSIVFSHTFTAWDDCV